MTSMLDARISRYESDGFMLGPTVLRGERLTSARLAVDRILSGRSEQQRELLMFRRDQAATNAQVHVVGAWRAEPALRQLAFDPSIVRLACTLIGTVSVRLFRDQLFAKEPHSRAVVPWHQDYSDWTHTTPPSHVTCWVALDDASEENGCLIYLPGSHRGSLLPKITRDDDMASAFQRLPLEMRENLSPQPVPVAAGGCILHHCMTVHASAGNDTPTARRAVALTYMHPDTRSANAQRAPLPGLSPVAVGDHLEGPLFPELTGEE